MTEWRGEGSAVDCASKSQTTAVSCDSRKAARPRERRSSAGPDTGRPGRSAVKQREIILDAVDVVNWFVSRVEGHDVIDKSGTQDALRLAKDLGHRFRDSIKLVDVHNT